MAANYCSQRRCQQTDVDWTASAVNRAPACHKGLQCIQSSMINSLLHTPCQTIRSHPANQAQPPLQKSAFHIPVSRHFTRSKRSQQRRQTKGCNCAVDTWSLRWGDRCAYLARSTSLVPTDQQLMPHKVERSKRTVRRPRRTMQYIKADSLLTVVPLQQGPAPDAR